MGDGRSAIDSVGEAIGSARRKLANASAAFVLTFLLLFVGIAMAAAQEPARDVSEASLADLANIQVYSASKHLEKTSDAPSSVTVITADEIQKYGYRTLADILRSVRGFYVTYDHDYSFVGVRGFGRLGDWNSRILLMVDGHRLNENVVGQADLGTEFPVDVDLIERVEIVRGPSSSLYGTSAFFAVINVITRKARELRGWELSFAPGSFETYQGRASYGGEYRGAQILLSTTLYNSRGQTLFFPEFNSPLTNHGTTLDTDDETHEQALASLSLRGFTFQGLFSTRDKGIPTAYFGTLFNDPRTRNYNDHQYFDLGYQHSITKGWQLELRTAYDQYRLEALLAYSPHVVDKFSTRGNWWTGNAKATCTLLEKQKITFGTEITDNLRQDQGDYVVATNLFTVDAANSAVWAFYAQDDLTITHQLSLSGGVRYDHYSNFGGTTNPRLALVYHPFQPTTFKLLYGSAFRAPNVFEIYPDLGTIYDDNANLLPELVRSEEIVVEQQLGKHFRLIEDLFRNDINRLISVETNPSDGHFVYLNSGGAVAKGIAVELEGRFGNGLQGRASFHYNHTGGAAPHLVLDNSPQELGKLNFIVPLLPKKLFASLDAQYTSPRQTLTGSTVSGFAIFNATLFGHTLGKHLDLSGSFYNIFNKKYFDPGRPEDVEDQLQQDGRNFRIKITGRF